MKKIHIVYVYRAHSFMSSFYSVQFKIWFNILLNIVQSFIYKISQNHIVDILEDNNHAPQKRAIKFHG
jgi:hypothetical protein